MARKECFSVRDRGDGMSKGQMTTSASTSCATPSWPRSEDTCPYDRPCSSSLPCRGLSAFWTGLCASGLSPAGWLFCNTSCCSVATSKSSLVSTKTKLRQSFRNKLLMSLPELWSDFDEENVAAVLEAISSHQAHGSSCARTICLFNLSVVEVNFLSKLKMGYTQHCNV